MVKNLCMSLEVDVLDITFDIFIEWASAHACVCVWGVCMCVRVCCGGGGE